MYSKQLVRQLSLIVAVIVALFATASAQTRTDIPESPAIRVSGSATASANPDLVQLSVAVESRGPNAVTTAAENANAVSAVLAALRARLSAGSQISTVSYSLDPNYSYPREGGEPKFVGFIARNTLKVESSDLNVVGAVIDTAISAGANSINSIVYTLRDQTKIRSSALGDAARQARTKAEALATAMGVRLGGIRLIEESTSVYPFPQMERAQFDKSSAQTPIQSGPVEIRADVTITFDIAK